MSVCMSVCPQGYLWNHTRDLYLIFFADVAYVRASVILRHADDRGWRECIAQAKC